MLGNILFQIINLNMLIKYIMDNIFKDENKLSKKTIIYKNYELIISK